MQQKTLNYVITRIICALVMFFALPGFVKAAPSVSGISGVLSDGDTVTITGNSFGASPQMQIFDDFESGVAGELINTGVGSAKFGQWNSSGNATYYGTSAKLSGNKSFTSNFIQNTLGTSASTSFPTGTRNVFLSWWMYVPANNNWPGEGTPNGVNWKTIWMFDENTVDDDLVIGGNLNNNGNSWVLFGNESDPDYNKYFSFGMAKGRWQRAWAWYKGSTTATSNDGEVKFWELSSGGVLQRVNSIGVNNLKSAAEGGKLSKININAYGRSTPNCIVSFDDVYIATGPSAQARVEVGNASTYTACTNMTILTPQSWTNTSINAEVNRGSFPSGLAYLYVIDANGVISNALPVTFGTSGSDTTRPIVTSTSPTNHATNITKNVSNSIIFNESLDCSTVNTSSITMSPNNIQSVTCQNSVITITPQNQTDSTTYAITATTAITDTAGNHLASPYTFSYTTATPAATCATDATLCTTATTCTSSWPTNNFCLGETPACKSTACATNCSQENWYLCTNQTDCQNNNLYWWENACRTVPEPLLWYGENLVSNPKFDTWEDGLPIGWTSYLTTNVEQNSLGARMFDQGHLLQRVIEPNTNYTFAYNLPVVNGSSEIWYYNTSIFNSKNGTITGSFTTPAEPISDHGIYFKTPAGSDNIINDVVLKKATLTGCPTDPALCADETTCTNAGWNYCTDTCKAEPCITPPSLRGDVNGSQSITTTDALLTLRKSLGLAMDGTDWEVSDSTGDVNCDGNANSTDALLILRYSLGLSMSETEWCEVLE